MIVIALRFPTGRYHATPWGRNVNEGIPEWPPSPYRLTRALLDVFHRRFSDWSVDRLGPILEVLSGVPHFALPQALFSHVRSYMSENQKDISSKQKIFDAFVALDRDAPVYCGFPGALSEASRKDLNILLENLPYLGRSESWAKAQLVEDDSEIVWNCRVSDLRNQTENDLEMTSVACLRPQADFNDLSKKPGRNKPLDWLGAVQMTTGDLLAEGWSQPPALTFHDFVFSRKLIQRIPRSRDRAVSAFCWAKFDLAGTVLPSVKETVAIAERVRKKLMGIHRRIQGDDPLRVSWKFSGKESDGKPAQGHRHAFYLPVDSDGDGVINHLYVGVKDPFDKQELKALDRLRSIWQSNGRPDVHLILAGLSAEPPVQKATVWLSSTPMVMPRHYRKGRGSFLDWLAKEIERECGHHRLPPIKQMEILEQSPGSRGERWLAFQRSRKGEAPKLGYGFRLVFSEPVDGPFSLGSGCHYGLGLFLPENFFPANPK